MAEYVVRLEEIDQTRVALVGGKGAQLGELLRIEGIRVPSGFCVTTDAFARAVADAPSITELLDRLSELTPNDQEAIRTLSAQIRHTVENIVLPDDLVAAVSGSLVRDGEHTAYAVRSSATAEDLPAASFAGLQDTYLNIVGRTAVLEHIRRCWASLFTERAVTYRLQMCFEQRSVHMAVVVQEMVFPQASGILFTADPVTSNRKVAAVEACFGLGEALVSGRVNADVYKVRDGEIIAKAIAAKALATYAAPTGGTQDRAIEPEHQEQPALRDAHVVRLAELGRRIESHFGSPQDIEWCLARDDIWFVQSRPITTLFPVPAAADGEKHVYVSVGHNQMMTDPMKPLGLSFWQLTTPRPMSEAGGRLFVDVTQGLASPATRAALLDTFCRSDPLTGDALQTVVERGDLIPVVQNEERAAAPAGEASPPLETDPAIVTDLINQNQASVVDLQRDIQTKSGPSLFDFILEDIQELRRILFDPRSHQVFMTAMEATWWLNENLHAWLGEQNAADTLARSVPHNVTSEMGLALLDVADEIRPFPDVVAYLHDVIVDGDDGFLDTLPTLAGGDRARGAIAAFLDTYGMRCAGEIDITRPRWSERPTTLLPVLLSNIESFEPGGGARRFEQGRQEALRKERELLEGVRALPDGERKASEVTQMIDRVRTFIGYREYPKYGMVSRYFVYKQALLREADRLVQSGDLEERDDVFYLRFDEFHEAVRTHQVDTELIRRRKEAFGSYQELSPPRVFTSDGEVIAGAYRRDDVPASALVGLSASSGTVEGRARVVLDMGDAMLETGDILVTTYTDPSWTPLFIAAKGLITEVGGMMTHGAVIAREYGLPAVVGVENATHLIRDGQQIRLHGSDGYVEILAEGAERKSASDS